MILDRTNEIFAPSNLKFWIISDERYEIPSLNYDTSEVSWADAKLDARTVFPAIPLNAYSDSYSESERRIVPSIVSCYGDRNEFVVWVNTQYSVGGFPERSHVFGLKGTNAVKSPTGIPVFATSHFAHELGHSFGLRHPFAAKSAIIGDADIVNPLTGDSFEMRDFWDQLYCDASQPNFDFPPLFYSSGEQDPMCPTTVVDCDGVPPTTGPDNGLDKIISDGGYPDGGGQGLIVNSVPSIQIQNCAGTQYLYLAGDPEVDGILRDFGPPHDPDSGLYRYGVNVMDYFWHYFPEPEQLRAPAFMTEDQADLAYAYATVPTFMAPTSLADIERDDGEMPLGCSPDVGSAGRHLLGQTEEDLLWWSNGDFSFANVTTPISTTTFEPISGDFDNDGVDDIVWYNPSDGWANYWWGDGATRTFTHQNGNALGENFVAFAGDFDGANGDDIFLYKVGTNPDSIMFSNGDRTFTTVQVDVDLTYTPVVADLDEAHGDDIVWYQPSTGVVNMWWSNGDQTFTEASPLETGLLGYSPFSGNFDGDGAGDVFWYRAGSGPNDVDMMTWGQFFSRTLSFVPTEEVLGTYEPIAGNFDGDDNGVSVDDIF